MTAAYPFKNQPKVHPALADTVRSPIVEPKKSTTISMHPAWVLVIIVLSLTLGLVCGTKIAATHGNTHLTPKNTP